MIRVKWREVFKFLSGAALVGSITNFYLYVNDISIPVFGYTISPGLLAVRSVVGFLFFSLFFYFGYLKK